MRTRTIGGARKAGLFALAVLQLFAAAFAPAADAVLEASAASVGVHVESGDATDCPRTHDHVYCQLCRALTLAAASGTAPDRGVSQCTAVVPAPASAESRLGPGLLLPGSLGARAPPLA